MNQHDIDDRDADLEALLRTTFSAEAHQRVPEARAVPPFPAADGLATVHPLRRKWTGVVLVAAALVGIVVGGSLIGREAMDARPTPSAPAGTSVAPPPSATATPSAPASTTASAATPTTPSNEPATRQVTYGGVVMTVPTTWNVVDRPVGNAGLTASVCLTTDTAIQSTGIAVDNCQLNVSVGAGLWGRRDVDSVGFAPDGGICGTDNRQPHETDTVVADELVVDGEKAEHRGFSGSCLDQVLDQWTVPTAPFVQFWRDFGPSDPAGRAQALTVVRSAQLPGPRSALRLADHGYITAVSSNTVSLDRITTLNQLGVRNDNPATYDYPLAPDAVIEYDGSTLSPDQLRALAAGESVAGVPALSTLQAQLETDGSTVTRLDLYPRRS